MSIARRDYGLSSWVLKQADTMESDSESHQTPSPRTAAAAPLPLSSISLTGYGGFDPNKIVGPYREAKECPCTEKTATNWDEVEKIVRRFKIVDTNPFGRSQNKSWAVEAPDKSVIVRQCEPTISKDEIGEDEHLQFKPCAPTTYVAGSYEEMGFSQIGSEKPCDQLKCIKCKQKVVWFDNYAWKPESLTVDYVKFLRANMPDFENVAGQLEKKRGARAYACHCSCLTVVKLTVLDSRAEVQHWECGKHSVIAVIRE